MNDLCVESLANQGHLDRQSGRVVSRIRGFTLVEVIVVVVILGIIAGLVGPRMMRRDSRKADQTVSRIASMFDAIARRTALSSDPMQLVFDDGANEFRVMSLIREEGFRQSWDRRVRWHVDPLIPPVELDELQLGEVMVDAMRVRERDWTVEMGGTDVPVSVSIELEAESSGQIWRVVLDGASGRAIAGSEKDFDLMPVTLVDLDEAGKRDAPW